jgi:hypothetical protein
MKRRFQKTSGIFRVLEFFKRFSGDFEIFTLEDRTIKQVITLRSLILPVLR